MLPPSPIVLYHFYFFFFFNDTATTEIYTLSLHDALPISSRRRHTRSLCDWSSDVCSSDLKQKSTRLNSSHTVISYAVFCLRSEEHTSELQSHSDLVCLLLLEKKTTQSTWHKRTISEMEE